MKPLETRSCKSRDQNHARERVNEQVPLSESSVELIRGAGVRVSSFDFPGHRTLLNALLNALLKALLNAPPRALRHALVLTHAWEHWLTGIVPLSLTTPITCNTSITGDHRKQSQDQIILCRTSRPCDEAN